MIVRLARTTTLIVIAITLGYLIGATIVSRSAAHYGAEHPDDGSLNSKTYAVATSCERHGPVSIRGFGYWWTCRADVHWQGNGDTSEPRSADFLTPDDIGKPVHVTGIRHNSGIRRAAEQPYLTASIVLLFPFGIGWIFGWVYLIGHTSSGPKKPKRRLTRGMEILNNRTATEKNKAR